MSDADRLRAIADQLDEQDNLREELGELLRQCKRLEQENDYLTDLLDQAGISIGRMSLSVGQAMQIESALRAIT